MADDPVHTERAPVPRACRSSFLGYQESFCSQFKVDLNDPNGFSSLGELVYEIYRLLFVYNTSHTHIALRMPPAMFALRYEKTRFLIPSNVS